MRCAGSWGILLFQRRALLDTIRRVEWGWSVLLLHIEGKVPVLSIYLVNVLGTYYSVALLLPNLEEKCRDLP